MTNPEWRFVYIDIEIYDEDGGNGDAHFKGNEPERTGNGHPFPKSGYGSFYYRDRNTHKAISGRLYGSVRYG